VRVFRDPSAHDALWFDHEPYRRLADAARRSVLSLTVAPRAGAAWPVLSGQVCRIATPLGPQAGDLNIWNLHNAREHLWVGRTRQLEGSHVTTYSRLWSTRPYHRPMATIVRDTLPSQASALGGRCHDLLGTGCDPFIWRLLNGADFANTCYSNLATAIAPYHLTEFDIHDVVNLFMRTGLTPGAGLYFMEPVPAGPGDYIEFVADMDLLCAISSCPAGNVSIPHLGPDHGDPVDTCLPLGVEVFAVDEASPRANTA
jgi:uncharacterized protein YcgI (DUF1989 family)